MKTALLIAIAGLAVAFHPGCKKQEAPSPSPIVAAPPAVSVDAAPLPPPPDAAPVVPDAAAAPADPLKSICPQVIEKIVECAEDKEFAKALKEGTNAREQKVISRLIGEIAEWPMNLCNNLAASYEYSGLLDHWDQLADPQILTSCGKLGAAVKAAGGLFGGDSDL
jgi:hypothetical protein